MAPNQEAQYPFITKTIWDHPSNVAPEKEFCPDMVPELIVPDLEGFEVGEMSYICCECPRSCCILQYFCFVWGVSEDDAESIILCKFHTVIERTTNSLKKQMGEKRNWETQFLCVNFMHKKIHENQTKNFVFAQIFMKWWPCPK